MKKRRSPFEGLIQPRSFRLSAMICCQSAAFLASSADLERNSQPEDLSTGGSVRTSPPTLSRFVTASNQMTFSVQTRAIFQSLGPVVAPSNNPERALFRPVVEIRHPSLKTPLRLRSIQAESNFRQLQDDDSRRAFEAPLHVH